MPIIPNGALLPMEEQVWDQETGEPFFGPAPQPHVPNSVEIDDGGVPALDDVAAIELGADGDARALTTYEDQEVDPYAAQQRAEFDRNLAEDLDEDYLNEIGQKICEAVERDIEDRQPWVDRFRRGMQMMGLVSKDMDDGPFPGASSVNHPLITEASVQFWARAQGELVPSEGPVKTKVLGQQTEDKIERAERIRRYMNWELMVEDEGWYSEMSRSMIACPMQGSVFKKTYRDTQMDRNCSIYVPAEDLIAPSTIGSLETAPRYTHRIWRTANQVKKDMYAGIYREVDLGDAHAEDLSDAALVRLEAMDGQEPDDEDARHEIYEHYCEWEIEGDEDIGTDGRPTGIAIPYVITVDKTTEKVLSIYRNWKQDDSYKRARCCFTHYVYVPGPGFYGLGLFHLIGGIQEASTGALRALLDGAATASLQGGWIAKDANLRDDRLTIEPGVWQGVDATAEELNKAFYTPPFREPSPALMKMLEFLTSRGEKFSSITELMTGEQGSANAPVGSTIAIIEQAQKVLSSIHRGLHHALAHELKLRYELIVDYRPDEGYAPGDGEDHDGIHPQDFEPGIEVIPVSDPNIFSSAQRVAVAQAQVQLQQMYPQLIKARTVAKRMLEAMKVPDVDEILVSDDPPPPMDPASEIASILRGEPVQAYPDQLHLPHLNHYHTFLMNPGFGGNPEVMKRVGPLIEALIGQRLAYLWQTHARQNGAQVPMLMPRLEADRDENEGKRYQPEVPPEFVAEQLQQIQQQMSQAPGLPAPPPDPAQLKAQEEQAKNQAEMQLKQADQQMRQQELQSKLAAQQAELESKREAHQLQMAEITAKLAQAQELHQMELEKRAREAEGEPVNEKDMAEAEFKQRDLDLKATETEERLRGESAKLELEQQKLILEREKFEHDAAVESAKLENERAKIQADLVKAAMNAQDKAEADKQRAKEAKAKDAATAKAQKTEATQTASVDKKMADAEKRIADMQAQMQKALTDLASTKSGGDDSIAKLVEVMTKPRRIVRDEDGNIIGSEVG